MPSRTYESLKRAEEKRVQEETAQTTATPEPHARSIRVHVPASALMPLNEGITTVLEPEPALAGRMSVAIRDLYEQLLFQSLVPAFDEIPLRRVFPFILYTPNAVNDFAVPLIVRASGCRLVHDYPFLSGSALSRGLLQTQKYQTRNQVEN